MVNLQKSIVERIEEEPLKPDQPILFMGAVELTDIPKDDEALIEQSRLIDLGQHRSAGVNAFTAVEAAGLKAEIVENTLRTMIAARQIEYLRKAGLPNPGVEDTRRGALLP
jgi:hypothetical protein